MTKFSGMGQSIPRPGSQHRSTISKEPARSVELQPPHSPLQSPRNETGAAVKLEEDRPNPSMIWAVNRKINESRNMNREIVKAETIEIFFRWHPSPGDKAPHITFCSRNLADVHTGSCHGHRPGEKDAYDSFFKWMKNSSVEVETPSEEVVMRMPPALYEQWQNSGEAFGHWINDEKFIGAKPERVSMRFPIALFDYWHRNGCQIDNEENKLGLYALYQEWKTNPADIKWFRPVVKPLAKLGENPGAYALGAYGLSLQAVDEDPSFKPPMDRVDSAVEQDEGTPRAAYRADGAVYGDETRHPAVPSGVQEKPQFLSLPSTEPGKYKPGGFGKWRPTNGRVVPNPPQSRLSVGRAAEYQAYGGNGRSQSYGKGRSSGLRFNQTFQSQLVQSNGNAQSRGQAYGSNGQFYRESGGGAPSGDNSQGINGQLDGRIHDDDVQGATSRNLSAFDGGR